MSAAAKTWLQFGYSLQPLRFGTQQREQIATDQVKAALQPSEEPKGGHGGVLGPAGSLKAAQRFLAKFQGAKAERDGRKR